MAPGCLIVVFVISVLTEINVRLYQHLQDCKGWGGWLDAAVALRHTDSEVSIEESGVETLQGFIASLFWMAYDHAFWLTPPVALCAALLMLRRGRSGPQWLAVTGATMAVVGEGYRLFMRQGFLWTEAGIFQIKIINTSLFNAIAMRAFPELGLLLFVLGIAWLAWRQAPEVAASQTRSEQENHLV